MFEKKKKLAESLCEKGIIVIYAADEIPVIFVVTDTLSAQEVTVLLKSEEVELRELPRLGEYATKSWVAAGYWCDLK